MTTVKRPRVRGRVQAGDVFAVSLADDPLQLPPSGDLWVPAIVLHASRLFKNAMLVGYFDQLVSSPQDLTCQALGRALLDGDCAPNYTGKVAATLGYWRYIEHCPQLLSEIEIPELKVGYTLYRGDEVVQERVPLDSGHRIFQGQGLGAVNARLKKHFRLP